MNSQIMQILIFRTYKNIQRKLLTKQSLDDKILIKLSLMRCWCD